MTREEFGKLCYEGKKLLELIDGTKMLIDDIEYGLTEKGSICHCWMYFDIGEGTTRVPLSNDVVITALKSTLEKEKIILTEAEKQFSEL